MRTDFQQFYVLPENINGDSFFLVGDECRHAVRVLRKKVGDDIFAVDGEGAMYQGVIQETLKDRVIVKISDIKYNVGEAAFHLSLGLAALKGGHFDQVVEKGVEIGIAEFQPLITERIVARPDSKTDRWRKKALTAMKQCGRSKCPDINAPNTFKSVLESNNHDVVFIAHEAVEPTNEKKLDILDGASSALVLIGPEGGFTDAEFEHAVQRGAMPLSLGPRRLRAETAAMVAATSILARVGELGVL